MSQMLRCLKGEDIYIFSEVSFITIFLFTVAIEQLELLDDHV